MHHKGGENEAHKKYYFRYKFMFARYEKEVANNCKDFYQFGLSLYISMVYHKFSTDNVGTVKEKGRRTDLLVQ